MKSPDNFDRRLLVRSQNSRKVSGRLPLRGQMLQDIVHRLLKAKVQDPVCFIDHLSDDKTPSRHKSSNHFLRKMKHKNSRIHLPKKRPGPGMKTKKMTTDYCNHFRRYDFAIELAVSINVTYPLHFLSLHHPIRTAYLHCGTASGEWGFLKSIAHRTL